MVALIPLLWLAGTLLRIYRQARFYQIDEYKSGRYLRWLAAERARWLPNRALVAAGVGLALGVLLAEAPGGVMLTIIGLASAAVAVWPQDEGEIKKAFRATSRAKRMLGAAFAVAVIAAIVCLSVLPALPDVMILRYGLVVASGLLLWLAAPLWLIIGNLLMQPVEALFRRRFLNQARQVLDDVHPVVIGITGSYGKTSTKSILAQILNGRYHAYPTPKSYNTLMGICIAINRDLAQDHSVDYFIAEMGAYVPGEIAEICALTQPQISIVTEVGPQHLERFGSLDNVAIAKYEIIKALPPDGVGVFNWDNPQVRAMAERGYPQTRLTVSRSADPASKDGPRFVASAIEESLAGIQFTVTDTETGDSEAFASPLLGLHNVTNILLATAVAVHEGMSLREVAWRVRELQPAEARLESKTTANGITIINDAYSANPVGAEQSLRVLGLHQGKRRLLITPGMIELGPLMESENRKLGGLAANYATDVILVGPQQTRPIHEGLLEAGFPPEQVQVVDTLADSVAWYQSNLAAGDTVLFLNDLPDTYS